MNRVFASLIGMLIALLAVGPMPTYAATLRMNVLGIGTLSADGDVTFEPASVNLGSTRYPALVVSMNSGGDSEARDGFGFTFVVPVNYVGSPVIKIYYATTATTGDVDFEVDYTAIADGETTNPGADQEAVQCGGGAVTVPGTTRFLDVISCTLTASNLVSGDLVQMSLYRDDAEAADTLAAAAWIYAVVFEYADA